jgi:chromate transporter
MIGAVSFGDLATLFGHMLVMSLFSIGGALTALPELRRVMVGDMHLLTDAQFHASVSIAQASPGPNMLFLAVMGYQAAGIAGALLMLIGFLLPTTALAYGGLSLLQGHHDGLAGRAFKAAMAPLVVALMLSSGWVLGLQASGAMHIAALAAAALLTVFTRTHVVVLIVAGATAGALGWL